MPLGLSGNGLISGFNPASSGFGKLLQLVRITDTTQRSTTSTTFVDATGMSITITPKSSTSSIILLFSGRVAPPPNSFMHMQFTDTSNVAISGAEQSVYGGNATGTMEQGGISLMGFDNPGSTSAKTYKLRFKVDSGTGILYNQINTGQILAIEVEA